MQTLFSYLNISMAGLLALLFFLLNKLRLRFSKRREAPEPAGAWPIIGHMLLFKRSQLPHITLANLADKYGPIFTIRIGMNSFLVLSSWEVAKDCYTNYNSVVASRPQTLGGDLLGFNFASFLTRRYDSFFRNIRKIIAVELLSNRRLELQRHIRVSEVQRSVKEIHNQWRKREKDSDGVLVDIEEWIGNVNLNVLMMMICGKRFFGDCAENVEDMGRCRKVSKDFFTLMGQFAMGDAIPLLKWLDLGGYEKAMKETAKEMDNLVGEWLEEHRQKRNSGEGERDFMDVMMSIVDEPGMDLGGYDADTVIKATCMTIIVGGTDTTTITLVWALSLLLNNREVMRKAQEEIDMHVGNKRMVEESDIPKLEYVQAIVKETLRLYPPGPLSGPREFSEDSTVAGYHVPAGTRLITNLSKIQTDPRVWTEPLKFKPERFLSGHNDMDLKGQNFELFPFGHGRRLCPGLGMGLHMMHLVLANLVHSFEIMTPLNEPVDMTVEFGITNHFVNPPQVLIQPRLLPAAYD